MKYILVLQWDATKEADYDDLLEIEEKLIRALKSGAEVDGHDMGSDEMNIFIATDNPSEAFNDIKSTLETLRIWSGVRVAYRESTAGGYSVIWPQDLVSFNVS